ncbi:MAG: BamA/TamA family outer membrane protein [Chitinophagales bacterium]
MRYVLLVIFLFAGTILYAQGNFLLKIIPADKDTGFLTKDFSYKRSLNDSVAGNQEMKNLLNRFYQEGYLEATYTDVKKDSNQFIATIYTGKQWKWAKLSNGNADDVILDRIGFREKLYNGQPFSSPEVATLLNKLLTYCENNGYPFAAVRLDSVRVSEEQLSAKIFITKNKLITLDSILVKGDVKIANKYLSNYLGLRLPAPYQEDVIKKITSRLTELPFLSEERPSQLQFSNNRAALLLYLKKKNASSFDFILGVLPNSATNGKLLVTGDGRLNLINSFGRGESLNLRFNQLPGKATQVDLKGAYPYLFNLPFGMDAEFNLYKKDTLYLEVKGQVGVQYLFTGVNNFRFYFRNVSNSLLSVDTVTIIQTKALPPNIDYNAKFYGIGFLFEKLDYRNNPRRGLALLFNAEGGNKTVKENAEISTLKNPAEPEFDFSTLYDSVNEKKTQFRLVGSLNYYVPFSGRSSFMMAYHGGAIIGEKIYANERYYLGGFHLLRGFDEQSILATQYHILTAEYHYFLSRNSFLYIFFDGSYVEDRSFDPLTHDTPFGFGAGFNFETKAGIFGLSYALGHKQNNPIEFRAAKIHFGYVNNF